jgi:hypothetical protein
MDPDLVRQQAEEEAAHRHLSRRDLPPDMRVEPVLPMPRAADARGAWAATPVYQSSSTTATAFAAAGWSMALGIAASCVLGVTVGLVGGIMLGVKLQLVPGQGALIGAAAGFFIGWQVVAGALVRHGSLTRWQAHSAGFRAALLILLIMAAAMFIAPHYVGPPKAAKAAFDVAVFWKSVAAGAMLALILGGVVLRSAMRDAAPAR